MLHDNKKIEEIRREHPGFWLEKNEITEGQQTDLFSPHYLYGGVPFKFVDLFAGIGGFRLGLSSLGGECVYSSEWDKHSVATYTSWYNDYEIDQQDFRSIDYSKIPDHDILCGGFPCQPFSLAGVSKKNSMGESHGFEDDKQGNLFFSILKVIEEKKPAVLFFENVKNLKSHDEGRTWRVIEDSLHSAGYHVFNKILDAKGWVPQHRERIFIVCFNKDTFGFEKEAVSFRFPELPSTRISLAEILEEKPDKKYMLSDKLWEYLENYKKKHNDAGNGFGYGIIESEDREEGSTRTLSARYHKDGSEILIREKGWRNPRRLTPREAMLLQGFDDDLASTIGHKSGFPQCVSDTQSYRQFGNSVVPRVVEAIGKNIRSVMIKKAFSLL
jgi:DNA (cytosine-5)-methyltransferase 1